MLQIIEHIKANGAVPVMIGFDIDNNKPVNHGNIANWLAHMCWQRGAIYVPWAHAAKLATTGRNPASGNYHTDQLHLSPAGSATLARMILDAIVDGKMATSPWLADNRLDNGHTTQVPGACLIPNPCFIDGSGAQNLANWSVSARFAALTTDVATSGETYLAGRFAVATQQTLGGEAQINCTDVNLPSDHVAGDQLRVSLRMKTINHEGLKNATTVLLLWWNGGDFLGASTVCSYIGRDVNSDYGMLILKDVTPPSTATKFTFRVSLQPEANASLTPGQEGVVKIAQVTVKQITRLMRDAS